MMTLAAGIAQALPITPDHPLGPLLAYRQWIIARIDPKGPDKTNKVPVNLQGHEVDPHDPRNWLDYATAAVTAAQWGAPYRVGFVLTAADPFFVLDIDGARQADGNWSPLSLALVQMLPGTAVEVSQSRKGLHVWGMGPVPPHGKRNRALDIELYTESRLIVIGDASTATGYLGHCPNIAQVAAAYFPPKLAAMGEIPATGPRSDWRGPTDDDELLRRALQSRSASAVFGARASFADLWNADEAALSRAYPDPQGHRPFDASSADAALAQHLAFWTGADAARCGRLMQRSALVREKWDREDYLPRTIDNACKMQRDVLQDKPSAADARRSLALLDNDALAEKWPEHCEALPRGERHEFMQWVANTLAIGINTLKAQLKDRQRAKREEEFKARGAGRQQIEYLPDNSTAAASQVERLILERAAPGEFVAFLGMPARVVTKPLPLAHLAADPNGEPPSVPQIERHDEASLLALIEPAAMFYTRNADGTPKPVAVPDRLLSVMAGPPQHAAEVSGLLVHPVVLPNGRILCTDGHDDGTGLFLVGADIPGLRAYSQPEAVAALQRIAATFLDGFEFRGPIDASAAVAGLMTAVQRRVLDSAPGLAVLANEQSSGKTTLARKIHVAITRRDMPASTFPYGNEAEAQKQLLATLLRSPAMVCFDNVPDGFTFKSATLSSAMTSASIDQRILGASKTVSVPTNCLFVLTGNNLSLGADEASRWLVCRLAPRSARPTERRFAHDVVTHSQLTRAQVLADVVGIVAGYVASGVSLGEASRFAAWDRMVRQPLIWAGGLDVAEVFRANVTESEPLRAFGGLVCALAALFGDREFSATEVALATVQPRPEAHGLREALEALSVRDTSSARGIGRVLAAHDGRRTEIDGHTFAVVSRRDRTNSMRYRACRV